MQKGDGGQMELISRLKNFGMTANEAKIYAALLSTNVEKASEIARATRIPRNKVYEVAESLGKKGFIEILPEKVTKFRAIPLDTVIRFQIENFQSKIKMMEETKSEMSRYIERAMKKSVGEEGYFAVYKSKNVIKKKI